MLIQHFLRGINAPLIDKIAVKYSTNQRVCTKNSRNCFNFNNFFASEHFYIDFPLFNKYLKHQGQMCTIFDD